MSTTVATNPTGVIGVVSTTSDGDRPNDPGIVQQAQTMGLLDTTDPTKLGQAIQSNPHSTVVNFAHFLFSAVAFAKEKEKQEILTPSTVTSELDLLEYIEKIIHKAKLAGMTFTVAIENGKMVPTVQKAAPTTKA